ncbi:MAG TPA: hypothetical protein VJQ57_09390 [Acidimicrobiia bacterium]|nr:hypothetical protein [Acidimicrobiia bacterium]
MKIACDIDHVTLDFRAAWTELYFTWFDRHPVDIDAEAVDKWNFLPSTHFKDYDEFYEWFDVANGWAKLPFVTGALGGLWSLVKAGHNIELVTARNPGAARVAAHGLAKDLTLAFARPIQVSFLSGQNKWQAKADVWIDDSPEVLKELKAHSKKGIRFNKPWNKTSPYFAKADDWFEVLNIVKGLA